MIRNKEFKILLLCNSLALVLITIILFALDVNKIAICLVIGLLVFCDLVLYFYEKRRYREVAKLSEMIGKVLNGDDGIDFTSCNEGELAILSSEISKMTSNLRDKSNKLLEDKVELANSIYDISHQLRTPLTSMNIVTDMLSSDDLIEEKRHEHVRELKSSLKRIDWLIESLLKISKIDAKTAKFEIKEIKMSDLIKKSLEDFRIIMELKDICLNYKEEDISIALDMEWSVEAIANLIKNCLEHTKPGGSLTIETSDNAIYSQILVKDSGEGFVKKDIPYLFDRFYKGENASKNSIGI
jgi:signal transduction histidine kinase